MTSQPPTTNEKPGAAHRCGGSSAAAEKGGSYLCHESYCRRYRVAADQLAELAWGRALRFGSTSPPSSLWTVRPR